MRSPVHMWDFIGMRCWLYLPQQRLPPIFFFPITERLEMPLMPTTWAPRDSTIVHIFETTTVHIQNRVYWRVYTNMNINLACEDPACLLCLRTDIIKKLATSSPRTLSNLRNFPEGVGREDSKIAESWANGNTKLSFRCCKKASNVVRRFNRNVHEIWFLNGRGRGRPFPNECLVETLCRIHIYAPQIALGKCLEINFSTN